MRVSIGILVSLMLVAACSKATEDDTSSQPDNVVSSGEPSPTPVSPPVAVTQAMSAAVAPACRSPTPAKSDDIDGLSIGMTADEVTTELFTCRHSPVGLMYAYAPSRFSVPPLPNGAAPLDNMHSDGKGASAPEEFYLQFAGPKGAERLVGISRILRFQNADAPAMAQTFEQIKTKYDVALGSNFPNAYQPWGGQKGRGGAGYDCLAPAIESQVGVEPLRSATAACGTYLGVQVWPQQNDLSLVQIIKFVAYDAGLAARLVAGASAESALAWNRKTQEDHDRAAQRSVAM